MALGSDDDGKAGGLHAPEVVPRQQKKGAHWSSLCLETWRNISLSRTKSSIRNIVLIFYRNGRSHKISCRMPIDWIGVGIQSLTL